MGLSNGMIFFSELPKNSEILKFSETLVAQYYHVIVVVRRQKINQFVFFYPARFPENKIKMCRVKYLLFNWSKILNQSSFSHFRTSGQFSFRYFFLFIFTILKIFFYLSNFINTKIFKIQKYIYIF
jgi:hypothetical protein